MLVEIIPAGRNLRLHHHGCEQVWTVAHHNAAEASRRDTDDGEGMSIDRYAAIQHLRIAAKASNPVFITENGDRIALLHLVVARRDEPSQRRLEAEHLKVVARNQLRHAELRLVVILHAQPAPECEPAYRQRPSSYRARSRYMG